MPNTIRCDNGAHFAKVLCTLKPICCHQTSNLLELLHK
uniref:Uncharacterized protein n=1 Tax=Arundo donax TaxID=35708 RepID=A0A0A9FVE1_ARUDO